MSRQERRPEVTGQPGVSDGDHEAQQRLEWPMALPSVFRYAQSPDLYARSGSIAAVVQNLVKEAE